MDDPDVSQDVSVELAPSSIASKESEIVDVRLNQRLTEAEKNKALQEQLQALKAQLSGLKDTDKLTEMDLLHAENVKMGRDKYKTLKQIRAGNTRERIDQFERM